MVQLCKVMQPENEKIEDPVVLSDETMKDRKVRTVREMKKRKYDALIIYADLEHGSNFEYLTGFLPRFEEGLLILYADGNAELILGNENLNKAAKSRIQAKAIHMPCFSLPNQPEYGMKSVEEVLSNSRIAAAHHIGVAGWKLFGKKMEHRKHLFDIPFYLIKALMDVCCNAEIENATDIFIGENGVRTVNSAEELAHYEYGAALAGKCMLDAMNYLQEGVSEMEVADKLSRNGQPHNVVTIMAAGERFIKANMYPGKKKIELGDRISITTGYKGGLQSRAGYAVASEKELPQQEQEYLCQVAYPYYNAVKNWLEQIKIGMKGGELYRIIEDCLPPEKYGWKLNPGHLCADEEWLCSPIYKESDERLQSGMILQIDIIPTVKGYGGISCESGIILADTSLRSELRNSFPEMWERIQRRREYVKNVLGINISEEVLPNSSLTAYCRPFFLDKEKALINYRN